MERSLGDHGRRRLRSVSTKLVAVSLTLAVVGGVAPAQDGSEDPPPPPPPTQGRRLSPSDPDFRGALLGDFVERKKGDEQVVAAVGGVGQPVWLRQPGIELRCDSVVIWGHKDKLGSALRAKRKQAGEKEPPPESLLGPVLYAIYAEGNVYLQREGQTIRADRVLIDFQRNHAYMVRAEVTGKAGVDGGGLSIPLTFRAEIVRATGREHLRAEDATFTTSNRPKPAYSFRTDWIEVDFNEEYVSFETAMWPVLQADTLLGEDTPLLVLPKVGGLNFDLRPLENVDFGSTSRLGTFLDLQWGGAIENDAGDKWVDWRLHTDYRSRRGAGLGLDFELAMPERANGLEKNEFEFTSYFQRDTKREDEFSERPFDGGVGDNPNNDRGRAHLWYRRHLDDGALEGLLGSGWRLDAEFSAYSDRGYLPEYFRDEVLTEKQQETFVQLRKTWENQGVSLFASYRVNDEAVALLRTPKDLRNTDYQVQTQYLPSLSYHLINEPLLREPLGGILPVNLSVQASAANVERRYDDRVAGFIKSGSGYDTDNVMRGDLEARITTPVEFGPVHVTPAFGGSVMAVDKAIGPANNNLTVDDDGSDERTSGFVSLRVGTEFHRNFDANSDTFDVNGLRHVISLDGTYLDRFEVTDNVNDYQFNDAIEPLDEARVGIARVRNRLQTHRDGEVVDWLDHEFSFLYYFDEQQSRGGQPFGLREDFAQPLQRIDFAGEEKYRRRSRDGASFMQNRVTLKAFRNVWFVGEADYDMEVKDLESSLVGARWFVNERLSTYIGRRTISDDSRIWTVRADYRLSPKWAVGVQQQHDFRSDRDLETRVSLYRRAYDYTMAIEFENDRLLDDTTFSLAIYPNAWVGGQKDPWFTTRRQLDPEALRWYR